MTVPLNVDFQLTDIEYKPLPHQPVRLVFGEYEDWQAADAGYRLVTDGDGKGQVSARVELAKTWRWVNIGFTPFSWPVRAEHLMIAAELEQSIPGRDGADIALPMLYRMDIFRLPDGTCSSSDFTGKYTADVQGRFTRRVPPTGYAVPDSGGMVLYGDGYQPWDFMLEPEDGAWKLKLAFKRLPRPMRQ